METNNLILLPKCEIEYFCYWCNKYIDIDDTFCQCECSCIFCSEKCYDTAFKELNSNYETHELEHFMWEKNISKSKSVFDMVINGFNRKPKNLLKELKKNDNISANDKIKGIINNPKLYHEWITKMYGDLDDIEYCKILFGIISNIRLQGSFKNISRKKISKMCIEDTSNIDCDKFVNLWLIGNSLNDDIVNAIYIDKVKCVFYNNPNISNIEENNNLDEVITKNVSFEMVRLIDKKLGMYSVMNKNKNNNNNKINIIAYTTVHVLINIGNVWSFLFVTLKTDENILRNFNKYMDNVCIIIKK